MRNKILVLKEGDDSGFSDLLVSRANEHHALEVKGFGVAEPSPAFAWDWALGLPNLLGLPLRSALLSRGSAQVLAELRSFQPAVVVASGPASSHIMSGLKQKRLYRGHLVIATSKLAYRPDDLVPGTDSCLAFSRIQSESLKSVGVPRERISPALLMAAPPPISYSEEERREMGLLTTMPVVLLYARAGQDSSLLEVFRRLLRSQQSFQVVVVSGTPSRETFKSISAPPSHPVKFIAPDQADKFMAASSVVVAAEPDTILCMTAWLRKKPLVLAGSADAVAPAVSAGYAALSRIPAEASFLVESALNGKASTQAEKAFGAAKNDPASPLGDVISALVPEPPLTVRNYQEN
jgi:hypothetical protein